jgi:hypothetical protein
MGPAAPITRIINEHESMAARGPRSDPGWTPEITPPSSDLIDVSPQGDAVGPVLSRTGSGGGPAPTIKKQKRQDRRTVGLVTSRMDEQNKRL